MFGPESTVDDVIAGIDLTGKTAVVTGASGGLGLQTAATLAAAGAEVIAAVRDRDAFRSSPAFAENFPPTVSVDAVTIDLASLDSVRTAAAQIAAAHPRIDILINNAGVMFTPQNTTADGFEFQFGVNHLGHFQLTTALLPPLLAAGQSRVVTVSSEAHRAWPLDITDLNFEHRPYDTFLSYGQSKSANVLMTVELQRRFGAAGLTALAVHPGTCATDLIRYMDRDTFKKLFALPSRDELAPENLKSVAQAAATTVWAATAPQLRASGGSYLADCQIAAASAAATDPDTAAALWELSERMVSSTQPQPM
jgi:NAD(P)-dependent dehydrogenase (short-subunit alcohol dehydrogenase family)